MGWGELVSEILVGDARVVFGDCRDVLKTLADCSVDSVVTDPPYELGFMGKKWDSTGIAYDVSVWEECLRVLKPGGHILAFGGSRTWHRMAVAIEDAGFEIRDSIAWMYGSGFPKSLDVSKAIDKRGGTVAGFEVFRDSVKAAMTKNGVSRNSLQAALGNFMLAHYLTAGAQPAIPNWNDYQIIRDTVGLGESFDDLFRPEAERVVTGKKSWSNSLNHFVPGENHTKRVNLDETSAHTAEAQQWEGWGTALKPAFEPIFVGRKPFAKGSTVAQNVLLHGVGGLNIDASRIGSRAEKPQKRPASASGVGNGGVAYAPREILANTYAQGRWPANVILDEFSAGLLDEQSGENPSRFYYCAKASKRDRNEGLEDMEIVEGKRTHSGGEDTRGRPVPQNRNIHPTVKPTALMRYLIKLVTPAGGVVLDPFTGSGSTGKAALLDGYKFVGAELTEEYLPIIEGRLRWAYRQEADDETLF
jgi:site-specific DNA-methyltransferase (adenine-specific)